MVIIWTIKIWGLPNFEGLKPPFKWFNYRVGPGHVPRSFSRLGA